MLKTIIKRDGTREPFDPKKINQWSLWSSKDLGDRVDWSSIVMKTVATVGEEISSQNLQRALVKECIRKKSWPYNLMAGKLYAAIVRKEMYGNTIPTVYEQHQKMQKLGLMVKLNYTKEQYQYLENIIDHDRDFKMAHFQIKQNRNKYSLADRINKVYYETPQFIYMRMAMALAHDEPEDVKMTHAVNWYNHFSLQTINCPTPNYMNLGTGHNGLASCCLYVTKDTAASIAAGNHIAEVMTYMSAGIGGILHVRSLGDPVRNGTIVHQGRLPYYQAQAKVVRANTQGGRGGACTSYFSIFDPEVETLIQLQNPRSPEDVKNRDIHFAFLFNKLFTKKVLQNEDYFTFNVFTAPDLYKALFSSNTEEFERLYLKYEQDESFKKNYKSSRKIAYLAWQQRNEVATLYNGQIDEMNRHTPYKETINSSNLCVSGDTKIITREGSMSIRDLDGLTIEIWNGFEWSNSLVSKTGNQQRLLKITTIDNETLYCTPYHKFYMSKSGTPEIEVVEAKDLRDGQMSMMYNRDENSKLNFFIINSVVDEDWIEDVYCVNEPIRNQCVFNGLITGNCLEITQPNKAYETVADLYRDEDCSAIGFIDTNDYSHVLKGESVVSIQRDDVTRNIYAYELKENDQVLIDELNVVDRLVTVKEINLVKEQPEVSTCSLAGIVITNIDTEKQYESACYYALKMIDKCIHKAHYELPHIGYTAKRRLNAGVGMLGLAYDLARKNLKYSSQDGLDEIHRISERHAYYMLKASLKLGKELGNAPWIHKTKWPEGWTYLETYKKQVDQIVKPVYKYDWVKLKNEIIENKGIRNSSLVAHMPTESSSKASGVPNCVYPIRASDLKKSDLKNVLDWVPPDGDILGDKYELAWDISIADQIKFYAVIQKFTDQAISADFYRDRVKNPIINNEEFLDEIRDLTKFGIKTQYYANSYTIESKKLDITTDLNLPKVEIEEKEVSTASDDFSIDDSSGSQVGCESGVCTL